MPQMKFKIQESLEMQRKEFDALLESIFENLEHIVINKGNLTDLINGKQLEKSDTKLNQSPEDLTEQIIIEPIFKFLGFDVIHRRTSTPSNIEKREADYSLVIDNEKILVESEPLNKNLDLKCSGIDQVSKYLEKRSFRADYGIATNGFEWMLLKYDTDNFKIKKLKIINLKPFFLKFIGQKIVKEDDVLFKKFYTSFSKEFILGSIRRIEIVLEEKKDKITKSFYEDYIKLVFGFDKKNKRKEYCLVDNIKTSFDSTEEEKRLFSVVFMSRLIFIKFLEDKGVIEKNYFRKIFKKYKLSGATFNSFYKVYLQPLFYEVLNTNENRRKYSIKEVDIFKKIPYLNGGLFREVIRKEKEFDVDNDIVELIIENLVEKYSFTLNGEEETLNPDILGLVFEKTINYLTGQGTDRRKDLGAYYTPDDVTTYISEETIDSYVFDRIKELLINIGWKDFEVKLYKNLDDLLENLPINNPKIIKDMLNLVDKLTIIDPACGSGHFLTSVLKRLVRIKSKLYEKLGKDFNLWETKKHIINNSIYGVDIEGSAVEIAKLRLWLSLIEDMNINTKTSQIETLPNIDYNIREGNSLIGWLDEKLIQNVYLETYPDTVKGIFQELKVAYCEDKNKYDILIEAEELLKRKDGLLVTNQKKAYYILKQIYLEEKTDKAVGLKEILETVRRSVYNSINPMFLQYLRENNKKIKIENGIFNKLKPFHWRVDFGDILDNGGFDIVIGNPPYGNLLKTEEKEVLKNWTTINCNEIACNFIEREIKLLKNKGYLSNILAMSVFVNERTTKTVDLIENNFSRSYISFFGTRPNKIFNDVEIRVSILVGKKDNPQKKGIIYTTDAIKFTKKQRPTLLENLKFESSNDLFLSERIGLKGIIAKVGYKHIRDILLKLKKNSERVIEDIITEKGEILEYRKTGGYWLTALEKYPYKSTKIDKLIFKNDVQRDFVLLTLNSSLFYLFWSTYENLRDLKLGVLKKFPVLNEDEVNKNKVVIYKLKENLSKSLLKSFLKGKGRVGEFDVASCKNIINEVDDFLCPLYGLSKEETEFVKNYDKHIRKNKNL